MKTLQKQYYIYVHCRPDGEPFYVGKSYTTKKYRGHGFRFKKNAYYNNVITKYGKETILIYIYECNSEQQSKDYEIWMIAYGKAQGWKLTNLSNGGEGTFGYKHTKTAKDKIRKAFKGIPNPEQSARLKGKPRLDLVGKKHSIEHNKNISRSLLGHVCSKQTKNKIRLANKGQFFSKKHKTKLSTAKKLYWKLKKQAMLSQAVPI